MNRWRFAAVMGYLIPFALAVFVRVFTKWGSDVEHCIFAFFVGVAIECIIGICGFIRLINQEQKKKEQILFWGNIIPMILLFFLFLLSKGYRG